MRAIYFSLAFLLLSLNIQAQFKYGARTQISMGTSSGATVQLTSVSPVEVIDLTYKGDNAGYGAGGFIYADNALLFFMTEFLFQKSSSNFELSSDIVDLKRSRSTRNFTRKTNSVVIPVAAGLKFNNFKFGVGPLFKFTTSTNNDIDNLDYITVSDNDYNGGFQFLIGYSFADKLHIDLKREVSYSSATDGILYRNSPIELDQSTQKISLNIGVLF
ncbi:MAG: outer membrane beta-barrel protein [Saprospiraceae bacterium]|nr:outer membrane beta-barrel protein [Saprospiraceae bacterium]